MARVLVAGAGALGSVFGGFLRLAGHSVTLLGRPAHLDAIAERGLIIDGIWGEHHASGFDLAASASSVRSAFDTILIAVKSYDTGPMAAAVAPLLSASGFVVSLQNGLGNCEAIAQYVDQHRVLAARVIFGAAITAPGCVRVTVYAEPVLLGLWHGGQQIAAEQAASRWARELATSGIPTEYVADIRSALWGKVFYNAALNPLGALLGVHYGALGENADSRAIMDAAIDEAYSVALAEGVSLPWATAQDYRVKFYERLLPPTFHHRSSMLQDLERQRRTEVDAINGEIWKRGVKHGIATPVNQLLTRMVRARSAKATVGRQTSGDHNE
ncbi:MAG: ketopantoate reductase family protein [Deltaproteobacteria bacterium]|nr:ketopantoate reductase family protein [Deltaproteobacteria bacterium]